MISLDDKWRDCRSRIDSLNKDKNRFQKEVTKAKKAGGEDPENAANILATVKEVKLVEAQLGEGASLLRFPPNLEQWEANMCAGCYRSASLCSTITLRRSE